MMAPLAYLCLFGVIIRQAAAVATLLEPCVHHGCACLVQLLRFCMNRGMDDCSVLCKRTLRSLMDAGERCVVTAALDI